MSFGFGVGDFIAALELVTKIRRRFVNAPEQFNQVSKDVKSLSNVLRDIEDIGPHEYLNGQQRERLDEISQECLECMWDLQGRLDKYQELAPSPSESKNGSSRVNIHRAWKRLKWDQCEIAEIQRRIGDRISEFNLFLNGLNTNLNLSTKELVHLTKDAVDQVKEYQNDQIRQDILNWLSPTNYATKQSDFLNRRQTGTGNWILETAEFKQWVQGDRQTMLCRGMPGAGKTILASIIIDHLQQRFQGSEDVCVAYLYCNFQSQGEQKAADLLANLARQLIQNLPSIPVMVSKLYHDPTRKTKLGLDQILNILHPVAGSYRKGFVVIDALDECKISDGTLDQLLRGIFELQSNSNLGFLATSRDTPDVTSMFKGRPSVEITANASDVESYLLAQLPRLPSFVLRDPEIQSAILVSIRDVADGSFLLAQLHLDSLVGKRSRKALRSTLKTFTQGSNAYDSAYYAAMDRIREQLPDQAQLAKDVLLWITCANRQLTTAELQHALGVEIDETSLDPDNIPDVDDMLSVCAGLVTVDEKSEVIRLVHKTTQEFFERTRATWFPDAHRDITSTCLTYMLFDTFGGGPSGTDEEFEARLEEYPFYQYAAYHWASHLKKGQLADVEDLVLNFLDSPANVEANVQGFWLRNESPYPSYSQRFPRQFSGLHLAVRSGLEELVQRLLHRYAVDIKTGIGRTPLAIAAEYGELATAALLLDHGAAVESEDNEGDTPLFTAAANGELEIVDLLVQKGADLNARNKLRQVPLTKAAGGHHYATVKYLVDHGAATDCKWDLGFTLIHSAAVGGEVQIIQLFLDKGADLEAKTENGETPLWWAAHLGQRAAVNFLAERGASIDVQNKDGKTPLHTAAGEGHVAVVEALLERGALLDSLDEHRRSALYWAAFWDNPDTVNLLVAKGADPDRPDEDGLTPLIIAAATGNLATVALLASRSTDPNSKDRYGRTSLHAAVARGHPDVVKVLLAISGIQADAEDNYGRTPLSEATSRGVDDVIKVFRGEEVNSTATESKFLRECAICMAGLSWRLPYYLCSDCDEYGFGVCQYCYSVGARCLEKSHELVPAGSLKQEESAVSKVV